MAPRSPTSARLPRRLPPSGPDYFAVVQVDVEPRHARVEVRLGQVAVFFGEPLSDVNGRPGRQATRWRVAATVALMNVPKSARVVAVALAVAVGGGFGLFGLTSLS